MRNPFLAPRAIAVVGASAHEDSVGGGVFRNLLTGGHAHALRATGFAGPVYGVNRRGGTAQGATLYSCLADLPGPVDLVVMAIPAAGVGALVEDAAQAGARGMLVLSAGYAELGAEGERAQRELRARARAAGLRVIGPNCVGVVRPSLHLNASFARDLPAPGPVALISQSGALVSAWLSEARADGFGLSAALSLGDKADVADHDVLAWLEQDDETRAIALYVESLPDPQAVLACVRRIAPQKPVLVLQGGVTGPGAAAAQSHTGALVARADALQGALLQAGALVVRTWRELRAYANALAGPARAAGRRVAIVTNAGGLGVLAADAAVRAGLPLAELSGATRATLAQLLPPASSCANPVDVLGDASAQRIQVALGVLRRAQEVDAIALLCSSQVMTCPAEVAQRVVDLLRREPLEKPVVACAPGWRAQAPLFATAGIVLASDPEMALAILRVLSAPSPTRRPQPPRAHAIPARALPPPAAGRHDLSQARTWLQAAGFPVGVWRDASTPAWAALCAEEIGFPVVLKAVHPDLVHKSDLGGVHMNLISATQVRERADEMQRRLSPLLPSGALRYVVEKQYAGRELIVGALRDPALGPLWLLGVGGVWVEALHDVALRVLPLTRDDIEDMIDALRLASWVKGERGQPALPIDALQDLADRCAAAFASFEALRELELNPLLVTDAGLVAVDARLVVCPPQHVGHSAT